LIRKITMKNPRTSKQMLAIANKYALAEEATIDTKEQKESGHMDQPGSSKGHNKRGKQIVPSMQCSGHNSTRSTGPSRVNLKAS
jgi:hypothetical protein